jgi:hypothetical protein
VNFEGDTPEERLDWFAVEDYVALLSSTVASRLRNLAKQHNVQEFTTSTTNLVRDFLLGVATEESERPGYVFKENRMRLYDVDVLDVRIDHPAVKQMLDMGTARSVENAIRLSQEQEETAQLKTLQALERERIDAREETEIRKTAATQAAIDREAATAMRSIEVALREAVENAKVAAAEREQDKLAADQNLQIKSDLNALDLARQTQEAEIYVTRLRELTPQLMNALTMASDKAVAEALLKHLGPAALASGTTVADLWARTFGDTPLGGLSRAFAERPYSGTLSDGREDRN